MDARHFSVESKTCPIRYYLVWQGIEPVFPDLAKGIILRFKDHSSSPFFNLCPELPCHVHIFPRQGRSHVLACLCLPRAWAPSLPASLEEPLSRACREAVDTIGLLRMPELLHAYPAALPRQLVATPCLSQVVRTQGPALQVYLFVLGGCVVVGGGRCWKLALLLSRCYPLGLHVAGGLDDLTGKELGDGFDGCADVLRNGLRHGRVDHLP